MTEPAAPPEPTTPAEDAPTKPAEEGSTTPAEDAPTKPAEPESAPTAEDVKRLDATLRDERKARLKAENDLKELRRSSMTEADKAIAEARDAGRAEALAEVAAERAEAKFRTAAAAARLPDIEDAIELLGDMGRFVTEDHKVDDAKIATTVERLAKLAPPPAEETGTNGKLTTLKPGIREPAAADGDAWLRGSAAQLHR